MSFSDLDKSSARHMLECILPYVVATDIQKIEEEDEIYPVSYTPLEIIDMINYRIDFSINNLAKTSKGFNIAVGKFIINTFISKIEPNSLLSHFDKYGGWQSAYWHLSARYLRANYTTFLDKYGWALVPNVLNKKEQLDAVNGYFDYAEGLGTGMDRTNPDSFDSKTLPPNVHGIDEFDQVAHKKFVWEIRKNPKVICLWAEMYGDDKLLSSFDRVCFMPAPKRKSGGKGWLHTDQSNRKVGLHCIQGLINLAHIYNKSSGQIEMRPTRSCDGTTLVLEGGHQYHAQFFKDYKKQSKGDWYKYEPSETVDLYKKFKTVYNVGPPGSVFLWDSRAPHFAKSPEPDRSEKTNRLVIYTSYQPASLLTTALAKKKQKAFDDYRATSHWAAENITLFPKQPQTWGNENRKVDRLKVVRDRDNNDETILLLAGKIGYKYHITNGLLGWTQKPTPLLKFSTDKTTPKPGEKKRKRKD